MSEIVIHSKFGKITAQSMTCVDIKKSIPESEQQDIYEDEVRDGSSASAPVEASDITPPE